MKKVTLGLDPDAGEAGLAMYCTDAATPGN